MAVERKFGTLGDLDPAELEGCELDDVKCRSCSGYGNCGYKFYRIHEGKPVSICRMRKHKIICEREGKPFDLKDVR